MLNARELRARNIYKVKLMSSGVFVIKKDGTLIEMQQSDYDSEDMLQNLLAKHPNLLAGNLIDARARACENNMFDKGVSILELR